MVIAFVPLLDIEAVMASTTLPRSSVYAAIQRGEFPQPLKVSARRVAWRVEDVQRWIDTRALNSTEASHG